MFTCCLLPDFNGPLSAFVVARPEQQQQQHSSSSNNKTKAAFNAFNDRVLHFDLRAINFNLREIFLLFMASRSLPPSQSQPQPLPLPLPTLATMTKRAKANRLFSVFIVFVGF